MGGSKSKAKPKDINDDDFEEFVRTANHEELSKAIQSKAGEDNDSGKVISKKESLKIIEIQKSQMTESITELELQIRKDELAARRFVSLKNSDLAGFALKKKIQHGFIVDDLAICLEKHGKLAKQIRDNKLNLSISKTLLKASEVIRAAEAELKDDYIKSCRRPGFDLVGTSDHLHSLGIKDDDIIGDLNALWMLDLEDCLSEDEKAAKAEEDRSSAGQ